MCAFKHSHFSTPPPAPQDDMKAREGSDQHLEVPYGYLTGMM